MQPFGHRGYFKVTNFSHETESSRPLSVNVPHKSHLPMVFVLRVATLLLVAILGFTSSASILSAPREPHAKAPDRPDILFVQTPVIRSGPLLERYPKGSRIARLDAQSKTPVNLTPGFFAAADPRISFDATKVLFTGKKERRGHWQIWEMDTDASHQRQITHCPGDCLDAAYLPRGEIVYTAVLAEDSGRISQVFVSKLDGSGTRQITFGPGDFRVETVLENGRVLVSAASPLLQAEAERSRMFYSLRSDGTGLAAFRCEHGKPYIRSQAVELDDGSLVFLKKPAESRQVAGELAEIRRGALHNSPLTPPRTSAYSPRQLRPDELIVARPAADPRGTPERLDLYTYDPAHKRFGELIYRDPKLSSVAAVPVAAHEPPRWYWSTLNPKLDMGYFICLDSYMSSTAPKGRLAGTISKVRVLTMDSSYRREQSLGEAPVEKDGSFYVAVPPDRPIRFELLDSTGRVLQAQRSWIWTRRGDEHGCAGCHEDRAIAPENRWPLTLRRLDTPTHLGVAPAPRPDHRGME